MKSDSWHIIRTNELAKRLGVSRTTLWRWERDGVLPPKIRLGSNSVGWNSRDIDRWIESRAS
jgi:excisionase family DNA binding protein